MSELLRESPLERTVFRFLGAGARAALLERFTPCRFAFGDVVVRQGEEADAYYVMTEGRARVLRTTETGEEISLRVLRTGDEFGEAALSPGGARSATVRCSSRVEVLRLERTAFLALAHENPAIRHAVEIAARFKTLHGFLYEFSNFGRLSAPCVQRLVESLEPEPRARGEVFLREGDPPGPMYVIQQGRVRLFTTRGGREHNLAFRREGEFFGEMSALSGTPRSASAEATTDTVLLALRPQAVNRLREEFPDLGRLLEERIAQYRSDEAARVPLDFATEMLPADASVENKVGLDLEDETPAPGPDAAAVKVPRLRRRFRSFPYVAQIDEMDCAAAALAMVCRHHGRKVALPRIRELCQTSTDGTSLKAICHAARELGLAARAAKVSAREIDGLPLPAIAHWEGNHWVVVHAVDRGHVHVADPAQGLRKIDRRAFLERWTGYAALFDYTTAFEHAPEGRPALSWIWPFFGRHRAVLVKVLLLAGVVSALQLVLPLLTQTVIDSVIVGKDVSLLATIMLGIGAALVFMVLASVVQQYLLAYAAVRIDSAILDFLTRRLLALPMRYFQTRRTGDIQRRLDGAEQIRELVVQHGIGSVLAIVLLLGCLGLMFAYSATLALAFLAVAPLYGVLVWLSVRFLKPILADLEASRGRYRAHQIDAIKGIEAVKAASAEGAFRDAMLSQFLSVTRQMFRGTFFFMGYDSAIQTLSVVATALFLWVGARQVLSGAMSVGGFVAFNTLAMMANASILRLLQSWEKALSASVLLHRLEDVVAQEPEQGSDHARLRPVPSLEGRIELRGVGFRYGGPESPRILQDVTLDVPAGQSLALVGRSGCGKTTLVKLVAGLLEPTEGTILFDRMDLATLDHAALRRHVGIVLQENHVFDGSIRDNIAFGDPDPDLGRVLWAARMANAHEFVMRLPLGYETRVGESGLALSGGQKQRVVIARALYADPAVLIFDEATSALDSESERAIQESMGQLLAGRTSLVIAHRLSTIRDADRIVVLERGKIAEEGTHDELMALRGLYFHLSSQQATG